LLLSLLICTSYNSNNQIVRQLYISHELAFSLKHDFYIAQGSEKHQNSELRLIFGKISREAA